MRSTLGRLVGRGALLAALGFGGFGAMYGASAHSDDVLQLADFSWGSVVPDGETEGDKPVADDGVIEVDPIRISEDFSWG